jgi:hemolysin activation/secretion protein
MKNYYKVLGGFFLLGASLHAFAGGVPGIADIPRAEPPRTLPSTLPAKIKQKEKPALESKDGEKAVKLIVQTFRFTGNQSFSDEKLGALLSSYVQTEIGFKELSQATKIITEYYRRNGYFLAQAYLPAQDIAENTVEIAVIEGQLGTLTISGVEGFDEGFMKNMAAYQLGAGDAVSEKNVVRNITLLNSLPSTRATAQLNPSDTVGGTDVEVTLQPLPRFEGYVGANTYGNRFTGREVLLAGARWNNPAGLGDQLSLDLKRSNDNGQRGLDLGYATPVHASGTLLSLRYNYVDYKLGGTFKALDAFGESQYFNIALDQPLVRDAQKGLSAHFSTTYKVMNDEVSTVSLENRRNVLAADFGLFGDWLNKDGDVSNQLGINIRTGKVIFKDDFAQALDQTGPKIQGGFVKYNLNATRVQYFKNGVNIALRADYQRASKNLDSVEKISTGGINRWRQFAELPSLADSGFVIGAELGKKIPANETLARLLLVDISPYGFIDFGRGRVSQKSSTSDNHVKSIHFGLGLDATFKNAWLFSLTASHQNRDFEGTGAENEARIWGQLQKYF